MILHLFRSTVEPELYGFSTDPSGGNLPDGPGAWRGIGAPIPLGDTLATTSPKIAQQIERDGYAPLEGAAIGQSVP